jgi:hypothetical protein
MGVLLPRKVEPVSDAPQDPKLRRPVAVLSYYPDATTPESAQTITVRPGEHREQVNIRLRRSPSYCVEGVLEKPTADTELNFVIARQGIGGATSSIGRLSGKILGSDGRIRVCDLAAAEYRLDVTANSGREVISFGSTQFSIVDRDVRNVRAPVQSAVTASGEVVLEGGQPGSPLKGDLSIALIWQSHDVDVKVVPMPGQFSSKLFPVGEYSVRATGVPEGWYLKDIAYGGTSVLNRNFRPGSVMGNTAFRVVLARDGGYAALSVTDADGKPVAGSAVTIYPAQTVSDGELADMVVSGSTDQNGRYQTAMLPPGKYYALALETPVEQTPDSMARLRGARSKAIEVTLNAGATAQVTLRPIEGY